MRNLVNFPHTDTLIKEELGIAGISVVRTKRHKGEVDYSFIGQLKTKLGTFKFMRAWTYWMVDCKVPLAVAEELYASPIGRKYVRVAGDCTCPSPKDYLSKFKGDAFVMSYHIDTQEGLNLFVITLRIHGLLK